MNALDVGSGSSSTSSSPGSTPRADRTGPDAPGSARGRPPRPTGGAAAGPVVRCDRRRHGRPRRREGGQSRGGLTRAGLPVPPGFCVTTAGLLAGRRGRRPGADTPGAGRAPGRRRRQGGAPGRCRTGAAARGPVPAAVIGAVLRAYLGGGSLSVVLAGLRSASTRTPTSTWSAPTRCWTRSGAAGPRSGPTAPSPTAPTGIDHAGVRLAVVVQRMVDAAGRRRDVHRQPGDRAAHEAVIDASPGLGEAVVSGAVNPDHFVVDTATGRIVERRLGDKRLAIRALPGGGTERVEHRATARPASPTSRSGRWPRSGAGSRRTTARRRTPSGPSTPAAPSGSPRRGRSPRSTRCRRRQPRRAAGLLLRSAWPRGSTGRSRRWACRRSGWCRPPPAAFGAPVADARWPAPASSTQAGGGSSSTSRRSCAAAVGRATAPRVFDVMEARSAMVLRGLFDDPRWASIQRSRGPCCAGSRALSSATGSRARVRARSTPGGAPAAASRRGSPGGWRAAGTARPPPRAARPASSWTRQRGVVLAAADRAIRQCPGSLPASSPARLALLGDHARPDELQSVLRGLPHNVTTEMDLALWDWPAGSAGPGRGRR